VKSEINAASAERFTANNRNFVDKKVIEPALSLIGEIFSFSVSLFVDASRFLNCQNGTK
jgi:hypothetical protein